MIVKLVEATPPGCFIATNASCFDTPMVPRLIAEALRSAAAQTRTAIASRLKRGLDDKQIPAGTDIDALTCFCDTLIAGHSSLDKQGAPKKPDNCGRCRGVSVAR